jgi:hypothetical protein
MTEPERCDAEQGEKEQVSLFVDIESSITQNGMPA